MKDLLYIGEVATQGILHKNTWTTTYKVCLVWEAVCQGEVTGGGRRGEGVMGGSLVADCLRHTSSGVDGLQGRCVACVGAPFVAPV